MLTVESDAGAPRSSSAPASRSRWSGGVDSSCASRAPGWRACTLPGRGAVKRRQCRESACLHRRAPWFRPACSSATSADARGRQRETRGRRPGLLPRRPATPDRHAGRSTRIRARGKHGTSGRRSVQVGRGTVLPVTRPTRARPCWSSRACAARVTLEPLRRRRAGRGFVYLDPDGSRVPRRAQSSASMRSPSRRRGPTCGSAPTPTATCRPPAATPRVASSTATTRAGGSAASGTIPPARRLRRRRCPRIRAPVDDDLRAPGLPREKVLAAVVRLLESTLIRVGNEEYARANGSYGLTTLRDRHAGSRATSALRFRARAAWTTRRPCTTAGWHAIVRRCQELPGQRLFQYLDERRRRRTRSTSADVNEYLREAPAPTSPPRTSAPGPRPLWRRGTGRGRPAIRPPRRQRAEDRHHRGGGGLAHRGGLSRRATCTRPSSRPGSTTRSGRSGRRAEAPRADC